MSTHNDTAELPRWVFYCLVFGALTGMAGTAAVNGPEIIELGQRLGLEWRSIVVAAMVVLYEMVSTLLFMFIPKHLKWLRRSAAWGAGFGLILTIVLGGVNHALDHDTLEVNLFLVEAVTPVPSLVAAAFLHMLVLAAAAISPRIKNRRRAREVGEVPVPPTIELTQPEEETDKGPKTLVEDLPQPGEDDETPENLTEDAEEDESEEEEVEADDAEATVSLENLDIEAENIGYRAVLRIAMAACRRARKLGKPRPTGAAMLEKFGIVSTPKAWRNALNEAEEKLDEEAALFVQ
ncbi:hypothetical protein FDA94_29285 [Herbidospora galbida]|uniref:DUF2637 domain-containing protein n=1 Tax=Herbidospora galbida TaxID=2575442 RepID=A0A4U3M8X3_9ACTN|nr:hypothetical protein [Herbidospora galbida]TKK84709.1 hypothetical protein FDA94_29285 [Herbidospora galbida]